MLYNVQHVTGFCIWIVDVMSLISQHFSIVFFSFLLSSLFKIVKICWPICSSMFWGLESLTVALPHDFFTANFFADRIF